MIIQVRCKKNRLPNPEKSDSLVNPKTIPMKHCVLFQIKYQAFTMNKFIVGNAVFIELLTIQ